MWRHIALTDLGERALHASRRQQPMPGIFSSSFRGFLLPHVKCIGDVHQNMVRRYCKLSLPGTFCTYAVMASMPSCVSHSGSFFEPEESFRPGLVKAVRPGGAGSIMPIVGRDCSLEASNPCS